MDKERDIRAEIIASDIVNLTDALNDVDDVDDAWKRITQALQYLSAKDTMLKYKRDHA
jgi:hypothetical protein